jgi:WD40 repeat protein
MTRESPYQGLVPYREQDAPYFFGREKETRLITASLFASPLTVLYGPGGVGKTSLLRAGIMHSLGSNQDLLLVIFEQWQARPLAGLRSEVNAAVQRWRDSRDADTAGSKKSAAEPVEKNLAGFLTACAAETGRRLMIILDQFEEYWLHHPEGDEFAVEFAYAVVRTELAYSFLIGTRDDGLANLDHFEGLIPQLSLSYRRIDHLDRESAEDAVRGPLGRYNEVRSPNEPEISVDDDLVDEVLTQVSQDLTGHSADKEETIQDPAARSETRTRIETAYLQLVMTHLWKKERELSSTTLRKTTLVDELGGAEGIVQRHLVEMMSHLDERGKDIVASVFNRLVTPSGSRIAHRLSDLAVYAGVAPDLLDPILNELSQGGSRILRPIRSPSGGPADSWYEIYYYKLGPAILEWLGKRQLLNACIAAEKEQRARAARLRRLLWGLAGTVLVLAALLRWALVERGNASSRALAIEAIDEAKAGNSLALMRAVEAVKRSPTVEAERALHEALRASLPTWSVPISADAASAIAFSADGSRLAVVRPGYESHWVDLVDAGSGEVRLSFPHNSAVTSVAFSRIGGLLATGTAAGTVDLWNAATRSRLRRLEPLQAHSADTTCSGPKSASDLSPIGSLAFSGDGKLLAVAGGLPEVSLWTVSGEKVRCLPVQSSSVMVLTLSDDGRYLATGGDGGEVVLWEPLAPALPRLPLLAPSPRRGEAHAAHASTVMGLAFGAGRLATASQDGTVKTWKLPSGDLDRELAHDAPVWDVSFSPDGDYLGTGSSDRAGKALARVWDVQSGLRLRELSPGSGSVVRVAWSPAGLRLATASQTTSKPQAAWASLWSAPLEPGTPQSWRLPVTADTTVGILDVSFRADGKLLAALGTSGTGAICNPGTFLCQPHQWCSGMTPVTVASFSADGSYVACGGKDALRVWETASLNQKPILAGGFESGAEVAAIAFSFDGDRVAAATPQGDVRIWELRSRRMVTAWRQPGAIVTLIALAPDGSSLAIGRRNGSVEARKAATGESLFPPLHHPGDDGSVRALVYSRDGRRIAAAAINTTVARLWDARTGHELCALTGHRSAIFGMAFSADGERVVTASADGSTKVWDAKKGRELFALPQTTSPLTSVAFSLDGRRLATAAAEEGALFLEILDIDDLVKLARQQGPHPLVRRKPAGEKAERR